MKRWKAILRCAAMTVVAAPGVASAVAADVAGKSPQVSSVASDDDLRGVFSRMKETGELSAKDRAILLTRPEIAEQVYLPIDEPAKVVQAPTGRAVAAACTYADRYVRYKSTTRLSEVRWNVRLDWCYTGKTVNSVRHYDYISKNGGRVANHRGLLVNQVWHPSPTPTRPL